MLMWIAIAMDKKIEKDIFNYITSHLHQCRLISKKSIVALVWCKQHLYV